MMFSGLVAKFGLNLLWGKIAGNAKRDWALISPKEKLEILGVIVATIAMLIHVHIAHRHLREAKAAGDAAGYARAKAEDLAFTKKLAARARGIEQGGAVITKKAEVHHAQAVADIAADAGAMRVRWSPRIAPSRRDASGGLPGFPDAAGGSDGAAQGALPELVEIPRLGLIDHGELCDVDRAKLDTLQKWILDEAAAQQKAMGGK
jgi:hypothetical protein